MATQDVHAPTLGAQGEPCAGCGAPLAADQRYCLECGTRRAEARLPFRDILAGKAPPPGAAPPGAPAPAEPPARAGLAFLAGLLCLLVALGVGVLIGRSGDDTPTVATTPAPQVITVNGSAPAATTPAAGSTDNSATGTGSSSSSSKSTNGSGSSNSGAKSSKSSKSSNKSVKDLSNSSGSDYQKKSEKLPKQVGTGGKPPPKDDKPAGGGSDFQDIG
jgi:hypothetical protein